jgi:SPP1 gp7 family putative phage head morphogenesis protein
MSKPFLARIGSALTAFAGGSDVQSREVAGDAVTQKGSAWPFNRVPLIDGSGYIDKLNKPYADSVWVSRAIKQVAGPIQSVTLRFYTNDQEITDAPWLNFWKRPVLGMTQGDFIEAFVGWLKLAGENFIILTEEFTVPFPDRVKAWPQLILARPDRMRAIKNSLGELDHWQFTPPSAKPITILPEQVLQSKYWNPYDPIRGMSEYESARVASESDYLSGKFALNLARANGDTGVIVGVEGGTMPNDEQMEQIRNQLRLKAEKSRRGEFSSIFVPANLKIEDPQVRTPDASFVAQRLENRHEIYIAFGLPPSMADLVANYSVGSASDRYRAIEDASMPTAKKICEPISQIASRMAGVEIEARFDWAEHPVLQSVRNEKIDAGIKLFDRGMPWEAISDYLHLDMPEFTGDDQGYLPAMLMPVGTEPATPPEVDPTLAEDPVKDALRAIQSLRNKSKERIAPESAERSGPHASGCGCSLNDELMLKGRSEKEIKLWKSIVAGRREFIRAYASKFNRVLMTARAEVIGKLERAAGNEKAVVKHVAADFLFNLDDFTNTFQAAMRGVSVSALQKSGEQVYAELGKDDPWKMPQAEALKFLKDRKNKLSGVPDEVFDRVRNQITAGLQNGDSLRDIAANVRSEFNDISAGRANVIASTETAAAAGVGRHQAMKDAGVQYKQWLTSGNANVRSAHADMNGTIVAMDELFVVTNDDGDTDEVMHPGDPDGEPWNVINCHCVEIASAAGPEEDDTEE